MRDFLKICRYSYLRHNIKIGVIIIIALFLVISLLFLTNPSLFREDKAVNRNEIIDSYRKAIDLQDFAISQLNNEDDINDIQEALRAYSARKAYYEYLIANNRIEEDYYHIGGMFSAEVEVKQGHEGTAFMFYSFKWLSYLVYILSVLIPVLLFVSELGGPIKNIIVTGLNRNKIFNSLYGEIFIIVSLLNFLAFVIGLIGGLTNKHDMCLLLDNGFTEVSTLVIYLWACFGRYILSIFFMGLTMLVGLRTRNNSLTIVYVLLIVAVTVVLGLLSSSMYLQHGIYKSDDPLFELPIIGINANLNGPNNKTIELITYHGIIGVLLYLSGLVYFNRKAI